MAVLAGNAACVANPNHVAVAQTFRHVGEQEIERAYQQVAAAQTALANRLSQYPQLQVAWKTYLDWDRQTALAQTREPAAVDVWETAAARLARNHPGLEQAEFCELRTSIQSLLIALRKATLKEPQQAYDSAVGLLTSLADRSPALLPEGELSRMRAALDWLARHGQQHASAIKLLQRSGSANILWCVRPQTLLSRGPGAGVAETVQAPVSGCLAGSPFVGSSQTNWTLGVQTVPSADPAEFMVTVKGNYSASTTSRSSGIQVDSAVGYPFEGRVSVSLAQHGLQMGPLQLFGDFRSQMRGVRTPYRGLRDQIARDRAADDHRAAYGEARRMTERGVHAAVDAALREEAASFNGFWHDMVLAPLTRLDLGPVTFQSTSDSAAVRLAMRVGRATEPAAHELLVAELAPEEQFGAWIHESAAQNYLRRIQPNKRVHLKQLLASLGVDSTAGIDPEEALELDLPDSAAIECFFRDSGVVVVLHTRQITYRGQPFAAADVRVAFVLQNDAEGRWRLFRKQPPEIRRTMLEANSGRLGVRDIAFRRVLTNVFDREMPREIDLPEFNAETMQRRGLRTPTISSAWSDGGWFYLGGRN